MKTKTCCFIGHRNIAETDELRARLSDVIEKLITFENVGTFLFGSKSRFNDLCHETVTASKEKHPHIKRIYVRAEYPYIGDDYRAYLLKDYEDTVYPDGVFGAGRAAYVERNREMIRESEICVFYYNKEMLPDKRKSGTAIAFDYAEKLKKQIINL